MTTFARADKKPEERSDAAVVVRVQQALAAIGPAPELSIRLQTLEGRKLAVLEDGAFCSPDDASPEGEDGAEGFVPCFALESGDQVLVREKASDSAAGRRLRALVHASLRAAEADHRERLLLEELGANWESLEALYEINTHVLRSGDINHALRRLLDRLRGLRDGLHCALFIRREGLLHPLTSTEEHVNVLAPAELGSAEKAINEMRTVLLNRPPDVPSGRVCWSKATSFAAAPFSWQGSVGFVAAWCEDGQRGFDSAFSRMLEVITYQASVMLEGDRLNRKLRENELLAQEVAIASSIQETLLLANAPNDLADFELASCSVPSRHIDGDFHDFFQHSGGAIDVLIGDVMGKGVSAALLGAATKSQFLRATANLALQSKERAPTPAEIVSRAASRISERLIALERFVTLCYARFDPNARTLTFVDCGHTSLIVESKSRGECEFLSGSDLPFGVLPDYRCSEHQRELRPGETYLFYSDGVTENRSPEGELFGTERLAECVQNWSSLGPQVLLERIRSEAESFAESKKFADDFTCVALRIRLEPPKEEPRRRRIANFPCGVQSLSGFRAWLVESAEAASGAMNEMEIARIELACTEVFTNCALHAGSAAIAHPVEVEFRGFQRHATVEVRHQGPSFDPLSVPPPSFDGSRDGGFGIYIVLRSADEASFAREPDGTNVTTLSFLYTTTDGIS